MPLADRVAPPVLDSRHQHPAAGPTTRLPSRSRPMRFFVTCVILAAVCVVGVLYLAPFFQGSSTAGGPGPGPKPPGGKPSSSPGGNGGGEPRPAPRPSDSDSDPVSVVKLPGATGAGAQPIIIPEGRVLAADTQNVPSERDGKIILLATPVGPYEDVPEHLLVERVM